MDSVIAAGSLFMASSQIDNYLALIALAVVSLVALCCALAGRALFYILVVPTTMPGAFFWKNKGFEQHAIDIGLAQMPQVGVVAPRH